MNQHRTILPTCRFCIGHLGNLKEGENRIQFQGNWLVLYRAGTELDLHQTHIVDDYSATIEQGFIWLQPNVVNTQTNYRKVILEKFTSWPTTTISYQYQAPFKVVMENLYDINHIAGTHAETLFTKEAEVLNLKSNEDITTYTLRTKLNVYAFNQMPTYQKVLTWILRRGKKEKIIQEQEVSVYFPGVFVIEDPEEYKNPKLERLTVVTIYPITESSTAIIVTGQAKINPVILKFLQYVNRGENPVLKEDKNILENCYTNYPRKIKLPADTIVDFAREKYLQYS